MSSHSTAVVAQSSLRPLVVALVFGILISSFILTSYSVPGSLTIRLAVIVALAVLVVRTVVLMVHPRHPITKGVAFVVLLAYLFLLSSLPAALTTLRLTLHLEYLMFCIMGLLLGAVCSTPFARWGRLRVDAIVIGIIVPFICVNAAIVWAAPPASVFQGIFRDRNYFAFYAALLVWLTHFGSFSRLSSFCFRGALVTFIVLSESIGGFLMLSLYVGWRMKVRLCSATYRNLQSRLFAGVGVSLAMVGVMAIALSSPALKRAEPIVAFLINGELAERGSFARRYHQASEGIRVAKENPWFGVGYGSPQYYAETMVGYGKYSLHNTYIEILAGAGLFPILVFVVFILFAFYSALRNEWARYHGVAIALGMVLIFFMTYSAHHRLGVMFFLGFILALALEFPSGRFSNPSNSDSAYL